MDQPPRATGGSDRDSGGRDGPSGADRPDARQQIGELAGLGLTLGLAIALFAWLGSLLDRRLGTEPLFVLLGAFLGFGAGFYSMYWRLVLQPSEEDRRADEADGG